MFRAFDRCTGYRQWDGATLANRGAPPLLDPVLGPRSSLDRALVCATYRGLAGELAVRAHPWSQESHGCGKSHVEGVGPAHAWTPINSTFPWAWPNRRDLSRGALARSPTRRPQVHLRKTCLPARPERDLRAARGSSCSSTLESLLPVFIQGRFPPPGFTFKHHLTLPSSLK